MHYRKGTFIFVFLGEYRMKFILLSALLAFNLIAVARADDDLKKALASPTRSAENIARDSARHPYETLQFFGIKPTMTVVELAPGGGWYTEILAPYLAKKGQLIAAGGDPQSSSEYQRKSAAKYREKLAQTLPPMAK
jgi:predicted methyltransferase